MLGLLQIFTSSHAADEVRCLGILVAVDAEELLVVESSKDLTQCGLSAPCLADQKYWLLVPEALVDEDCKPPQLPADDKFRYSKVGWEVFECLAQVILLEVGIIELLFVYLAL